MLKDNPVNTPTSTNKRPPDERCKVCGEIIEPIFRAAFMEFPARWLNPNIRCRSCVIKEEQKKKLIQEQLVLNKAFTKSRISPRFKQHTFKNFVITKGTQYAYEIATQYELSNGGLLFYGPCGVGKTHLAAAIANNKISSTPTLFISCPNLLSELREGVASQKKENYHYLINLARTVQFLVLDDIGAEKSSEWVQEILFLIINYRYEQMLPTIFTTDCSLDDLEAHLNRRITSRIIEMCRCIRLEGSDFRLQKRREFVAPEKKRIYG